jgi:hypothetical protein
MGKCIKILGAIPCGQETVTMSEYCEIHQPTSAREFTVTIEEEAGGRALIKKKDDFNPPGGSSPFGRGGGGIL